MTLLANQAKTEICRVSCLIGVSMACLDAVRLAGVLRELRSTIELGDIERRLTALEAQDE